jgi:hypothetical protein
MMIHDCISILIVQYLFSYTSESACVEPVQYLGKIRIYSERPG